MIIEHGKVVIKKDGVDVIGFASDSGGLVDGMIEALIWARIVIDKQLEGHVDGSKLLGEHRKSPKRKKLYSKRKCVRTRKKSKTT